MRVEARFRDSQDSTAAGAAQGQRAQDGFRFFTRGQIALEHRTTVGDGTLRTVLTIQANSEDDGNADVVLDNAFIQMTSGGSGWTAGRTGSRWNFWGGDLLSASNGAYDPTTELFAYTFGFGGGLFLNLSVETPNAHRGGIFDPASFGDATVTLNTPARAAAFNAANPGLRADIAGLGYGQNELPSLTASFGVIDQPWGTAQIMAALQQIRHNQDGVSVDDEIGWAIGAGVTFDLDMLSQGSSFTLQGQYANGATAFTDAPTSFSDFVLATNDAVLNRAGTGLETVESWSVAGAFNYAWTSNVRQVFQAAYGEIDYPTAGYVMPVGGTLRSAGTDNGRLEAITDYSWWQLGTAVYWEPVDNLTIAGDVVYTAVDTDIPVVNPRTGVASNDSEIWASRIRIQRDF